MASNLAIDEITAKVRAKLNQEKVKLWLIPYTTEDGVCSSEHIQILADKYCQELELKQDVVRQTLEDLRKHAVEKLAAKKKFHEQGIATLKVKLTGKLSTESSKSSQTLNIEINLAATGQDLKQYIARDSGIAVERLKLISAGKIVEDDVALSAQGIKTGSQLMGICLTETEAEARQQQQQAQRLQRTVQAAHLLSANEDDDGSDGNYYVQVADQNGKPLDLPKEERQALVFAMTLHEKGRSALKKKQHADALLLLLEAEKEFNKCRANILELVDNYALVCLDIVWCYLCLQNMSDLPDAERKLNTCDMCFRKSYGPNLERLALVKGGTGTEKALFMRLHLLQAVLAYHQQKQSEAVALLQRAEQELQSLQVDDSLLTQVMNMGFTAHEARLGLRLCEGNVQLAIAHIMKRRDEKKELKEKEKEEKRLKKLGRKLGKTADGQIVNASHYGSLVAMGFGKGAAAEALRQTNNDIGGALEVLQLTPSLLSLPDPEQSEPELTDEQVQQVQALGFSEEMARAALKKFHSVEEAVEELLKCGGQVPDEWLRALTSSKSNENVSTAAASTSKSAEEREHEQELIRSVVEDLSKDEDDHLDLTLEEEAHILHMYKAYLSGSS